MYFRDQNPRIFEKYGQIIYSLNPHRFKSSNRFTLSLSASVAISLFALIVFNSLMAGGAVYIGSYALFGLADVPLAVSVGCVLMLVFIVFWWLGYKSVQVDKVASSLSERTLLEGDKGRQNENFDKNVLPTGASTAHGGPKKAHFGWDTSPFGSEARGEAVSSL
jgi:hypothetical protein